MIINVAADDVRGEQIRGELLAVERAAERLCEELGGRRLGKARVALDKDMTFSKEADEQRFDELVFSDNDAVELLFYAPRGVGNGSYVRCCLLYTSDAADE